MSNSSGSGGAVGFRIIAFSKTDWQKNGDVYELHLPSGQTGAEDDGFVAIVERAVGCGGECAVGHECGCGGAHGSAYVQSANAVYKLPDGGLYVSGASEPFDGRIVVVSAGGDDAASALQEDY